MKRLQKIALNKRIGMIIAGAAVVVVVGVTGVTLALLHSKTDVVANEFAGAGVNIGVVEKKDASQNEYSTPLEHKGENGTDNVNTVFAEITANTRSADKVVAVRNITSQEYPTTDTYVRVRLVPSIIYNDTDENRALGIANTTVAVDMKNMVTYTYGDADGNTGYWKYQDVKSENSRQTERYYYYTEAIIPGAQTSDLISAVSYSGVIPENAHFELQVLTEGIAAKQTGSLTAWGLQPGGAAVDYSYFADLKELKNL